MSPKYTHYPNNQHATFARTNWTFDALNLLSVTGPDPNDIDEPPGRPVTSMTHTAEGRLDSETSPSGHVTEFEYDLAGNVAGVIASPPTFYEYDAQNRLKKVIDPEGGITEYALDLAGRLTSVKDPVNNVTTYAYDNADRLLTRTDPRGKNTQYAYDDASRLTLMTDRNGRQTRYTYNTLDQRTKEEWLDSQGAPIHTINYAYDSAARLASASDAFSSYAYTYSPQNNLLTSVDNLGTPQVPRLVLTYAYNVLGLRNQITDNLGATISLGYDSFDSLGLVSLARPDLPTVNVTLGSDAAGRLTQIARWLDGATATTTTFDYDIANRVTGITHKYGTTTLSAFSYGYNPRGDLLTYTGPEGTLNYAYDDTRQLTSATGARNEAYSYDANGNRTMAGYTVAVNNRLLSDGTHNYEYDDEGNRTRRTHIATGEVTEYTWDYRNRLTKAVIENSGGTIIRELRFTYDVNNNLIIRWTDPDGAGPQAADQVFTAYDGDHAYADFNAAGALLVRYLRGQNPDQWLARVYANGEVNWYAADLVNSVRQIVAPDGTILDAITYDSFGNVLSETNPSEGDRFKFTGRELAALIGLYWYRARWYDPAVGRFISEDPMGFGAGDPNLARYVGNHPLSAVDPRGLFGQVRSLTIESF